MLNILLVCNYKELRLEHIVTGLCFLAVWPPHVFLVASPRLNPLDLPKTQKPVRQKKLYSSSFAIVQYCKYKSSGKYEENCFCSICTDELS